MGTAFRQLSHRKPRAIAAMVTLALVTGPVLAGLVGTAWPAANINAWTGLLIQPGLGPAIRATLLSGLLSTALALLLAILPLAAWHSQQLPPLARRLLGPLVAMPHAAFAIGLAFLLAPSGWLARLASPWLTGWQRPPDLGLVADAHGLALALGLALREAPFLAMVLLAALGQVDVAARMRVARSLGYRPITAWIKSVLPALYPQIRLPLYAVLAYGLSTVDMALILGPTAPPTLAVLVTRWSMDPDMSLRPIAAAGALVQIALVIIAILFWAGAERLVRWACMPWLIGGGRGQAEMVWRGLGGAALLLIVGAAALALLLLGLWSVAGRWPFPDSLPSFSLRAWQQALILIPGPAWTTALIASVAAIVAVMLALACLEQEARQGLKPATLTLWMLYLPLLVPQIGFVYGQSVVLSVLRWEGTMWAVVWGHLVFVLPYVFLTLADAHRALDPRLRRTAHALGAGPWRCFGAVVLPLLLRPILLALAVGFSVSVALYLPTLQLGAGRIATLTTEAVALAGGADRRVVATLAFAQLALPALMLAFASLIPAALSRPRAGRAV